MKHSLFLKKVTFYGRKIFYNAQYIHDEYLLLEAGLK